MKNIKITLIILIITNIIIPAYAATYKYDDLNRLTDVTYDSGKKIHYTYDASGNILNIDVTGGVTATPTPEVTLLPTETPTLTPTPTIIPTVTLTPTPTPALTTTPEELLANPSFNLSTKNWSLWTQGVAASIYSRDTATYDTAPASYKLDITNKGTQFYDIQLYTTGIKVEAGKKYKLTFKAKSEGGTATPLVYLMKASEPWNTYTPAAYFKIGNSWSTYETTFAPNITDTNARITFYLGNKATDGSKLYLDSFSLKEVDLLPNPSFTTGTSNWSFWSEGDAKVTGVRDAVYYDSAPASYRVDCTKKGSSFNNIQLYTKGISLTNGTKYRLTFRAKCDKGTATPSIVLMTSNAPWKAYTGFQTLKIQGDWATYQVDFIASGTDPNGRLTFYLGGKMEDGSKLYVDTLSLKQVK